MTLDESTDRDKIVEEKGLHFLFDPMAASMIDEVHIDYDHTEDSFSVQVPNGPQSSC